MDLYELTRTLVRRGCPEHPRLKRGGYDWCEDWFTVGSGMSDRERVRRSGLIYCPDCCEATCECGVLVHPNDARAIWTLWALEWFVSAVDDECVLEHWNGPTRPTGNTEPGWDLQYMRNGDDSTGYDGFGPTILEAIEAATRHLEPKS